MMPFLFSLPSFSGAVEVGSSYAEAERGELSGDGVLRQRGLSAVVGVRIGRDGCGAGDWGVTGLSVICRDRTTTVIVDD